MTGIWGLNSWVLLVHVVWGMQCVVLIDVDDDGGIT